MVEIIQLTKLLFSYSNFGQILKSDSLELNWTR